ncbi:YqaJ-like recombinase protein [Gemmobacter caeni]|jgi:predicted phage-related endonuclease|uniref:YqaJ-like recombinase protein n=1 Tax=Gemmobacter caeni TaxID=589035 RepID=A0A2T6B8W6_9RHOB|nr:YqaJ viral recombinase family protein [Gemmobacter caeni]PTX52515.1 YqaJ-like recombinase protein [Gemmobacter caeni]TWJ02814.1 YqaJ-like recombinase protein [Gemmobacter caeni]
MSAKQDKRDRYQAFDAAALAEAAAPAPTDFPQMERRLRALIDLLPQRPVIQDHHVNRWLDRTIAMSIGRVEMENGEGNASVGHVHAHALWHVRRASAIGGSEMGTIVKHFRGDRGNFTSAKNLALEKLLIMSPQRSTPEMARGNRAEPWLQRMYHEEHGVRSDEQALGLLKGYRWSRLPQMVGTPDDIVILPDGRRRLVDYKCPSADVNADYEKNGVSFDYVCQVHHYGILSQSAGGRFDEMEVAVFDPRYFVIHQYAVPRDTDLIQEIMKSARAFWDDFVMNGLIPDDIAPDALEIREGEMYELGMQAAILKMMADEVDLRKTELLSRISAMGSEWHELATGKLDLGFASFTRARKWDEAVLSELAQSVGIDPQAHLKETGKPDTDKAVALLAALHKRIVDGQDPGQILADIARDGVPMKSAVDLDALEAALREAGVNTTPAAGLSEKFLISQKKKGPDADNVRAIKAQAIDLADTLEEVVRNEGNRILQGDPDEDPNPV